MAIIINNFTVVSTISERLYPHHFGDDNSTKFSGIILKDGKARILIFFSNKVNVTGVLSLKDSEEVLKKNIPNVQIIESRIVNICASTTLSVNIDFDKVYKSELFEWEPELFPGILYRKDNHVAIFFRSKKLILTGFKDSDDIDQFFLDFLIDLPTTI